MVWRFLQVRPMKSFADYNNPATGCGKSGILTDSISGFPVLMPAAKIAKSPL